MDKMTCTYCGRRFPKQTMTPLYEENKTYVHHYCEQCLSQVKANINSLHYRHLFSFGEKGNV